MECLTKYIRQKYRLCIRRLIMLSAGVIMAFSGDQSALCRDVIENTFVLRPQSALERSIFAEEFSKQYPGVAFVSPGRVNLTGAVTIGKETVLYPGVTILSEGHRIGQRCELLAGTTLQKSNVGAGAKLEKTTVADSQIGDGVNFLRMNIQGSTVGNGTSGTSGAVINCRVGNNCNLWFYLNARDSFIGNDTRLGGTIRDAHIGNGVVSEHADSQIIGADFPNTYLLTDDAGMPEGEMRDFPNCSNIGAGTKIEGKAKIYTIFTGINSKVTGDVTIHFAGFVKGVINGTDVPEVLPFSFTEGQIGEGGTTTVTHRIGWIIDKEPAIVETFIRKTQDMLPGGRKNDVYRMIQSALRFGKARAEKELASIEAGAGSRYGRQALEEGIAAYEKALANPKWRGPEQEIVKAEGTAAAREFQVPRVPKTLRQLQKENGAETGYAEAHWPGVRFEDPESTVIDETVAIGEGSIIGANTILEPHATLGPGCNIQQSRVQCSAPDGGVVLDNSVVLEIPKNEKFNFVEKALEIDPAHSLRRFGVNQSRSVLRRGAHIKDAVVVDSELGQNARVDGAVVRFSVVGADNNVLPGAFIRMSATGSWCTVMAEAVRTYAGDGLAIERGSYAALIAPNEFPIVDEAGEYLVAEGLPNPVKIPQGVKCANYSGRSGGSKGLAFMFMPIIDPGTNILCRYERSDPGTAALPSRALSTGGMTVLLPFCHVSGQVVGVIFPGTINHGSSSPKQHKIGEVFDSEPERIRQAMSDMVALLPADQKGKADLFVENVLRLGIKLIEEELEKIEDGRGSRYLREELESGLAIYKHHLLSSNWKMRNGVFQQEENARNLNDALSSSV